MDVYLVLKLLGSGTSDESRVIDRLKKRVERMDLVHGGGKSGGWGWVHQGLEWGLTLCDKSGAIRMMRDV
jgi:hypothetical protein